MTNADESRRSAQARVAALTRIANEGGHKVAAHLNEGKLERYMRKVDPDQSLPLNERTKRAEALLRADMQRLAIKSAEARRARKRQ